MKRGTKAAIAVVTVLLLLLVAAFVIYGGGRHRGPGVVTDIALSEERVADRLTRQRAVEPDADHILFGDLHVHTTFSSDAFMSSLPLMGGSGAHPPADACDFARFCSGLDFYALTDHAESLTPRHWRESIESVRACNAVAGTTDNPDLVAFMGFEWTQVGTHPDNHYGHKNVIFRDTDDASLPARPISSGGLGRQAMRKTGISLLTMASVPIRDFRNRREYLDLVVYQRELRRLRDCPADLASPELPGDCRENAPTPDLLYRKLGEWGLEHVVIPHGTTWGFYTPPGYEYESQLAPELDSPQQSLIEVFSGHGNSEEYRDWRAIDIDDDGNITCPLPSENYEPCCHRAGEIIRSRCDEPDSAACEERVVAARAAYAHAGVAGHLTVPGAGAEDWGNCGQCVDCFLPAFNFRPGGSAQAILATGHFDGDTASYSTMGFIASSDNHSARPGTGYKEYARTHITDVTRVISQRWRDRLLGERAPPSDTPREFTADDLENTPPFRIVDLERQSSFYVTGGLVAVHAASRSRDDIWEAIKSRNVYGTSGERILLWFTLENGAEGAAQMGSQAVVDAPPRFSVKAAGAFEQLEGCDHGAAGPGEERLQNLCLGECYRPGTERRELERIEVIRIRRQRSPDEDIAPLIEDPWLVLPCEGPICEATFEDPDAPINETETVYYVRAIQEPTQMIGADPTGCEGIDCRRAEICHGDWRTPESDDCLAPESHRAWSSPIFVRRTPPAVEVPPASDTPPVDELVPVDE